MDSSIEDFDLEPEVSTPWKRALFEVSLVLAVVVLFGLIGVSAYRAVEEELQYQKQLGGELLVTCQRLYWEEVYDPDQVAINSEALNVYYSKHTDCKIFNVTELDPLFFESVR
ncbi:MAG: hypothetical protein TR69_WS6001000100 [candidate division WS6 bacterium OLB20]|uniref:Uncharacterized protein n=1 Tax=candidate division WS6 bacterium OLB20 TaxID=1617426 RepID=A0A136M017_9BACT|nr:MAG: hypothetical protein TR69_WS6001000100 [candidate division WS6 bacterium OLB20]